MSATAKPVPVQQAYDDLVRRSLAGLPCELSRLIYLASTREYNTGSYHHEGLAFRFTPEVARKALEIAHRQVFYTLSAYSLEQLVDELDAYMRSSRLGGEELLRTWERLEPYRVAIPTEVNSMVARLFISNLRLAVAIVKHRLARDPLDP